ncbi:CDGSH iron-sulfur domain-containing protein [Streptomyces sp. NEAU-YJ-81]|uniref:CDGSH iron-sulfur domain-containing protein n=1 Tax=Streptomyces sp. NEAU-YJ-81 TaxID=2820288 RepID=UPI0035B3739A
MLNEHDERDEGDGRCPEPGTGGRREHAVRVTLGTDGPMLIEGPVEVALPDGRVVRSDRFTAAVCLCGLSARYPWCDTSHRRRPPRSQRNAQ